MEDKKILLSICIPTYNGASGSLRMVLDNAIICAERYPEEVEIIVSDNCSTDSTHQLLEQYQNIPYLCTYRNDKNLGYNGNMLLLTDKYARGVFCWLVGDDDVININAFDFVINSLRNADFDFLSLGFKQIDWKAISEEMTTHYDYTINKGTYAEVLDKNCKRGNSLATFMGSSIFKTKIFRAVDKSRIDANFNCFINIFPNAYLFATGYYNKGCAYIPQPVLFPIIHHKDWATSDNMYMIASSALVDMYDYFLSLGMKKSDLYFTRRRLIYDNLIMGIIRLLKGEKVNRNLLHFYLESLKFPKIHYLLIGNMIRKISGKKLLDIG